MRYWIRAVTSSDGEARHSPRSVLSFVMAASAQLIHELKHSRLFRWYSYAPLIHCLEATL